MVTVGYGEDRERVAYDLVVVARGFDGHWFERLLSREARDRLTAARAGDELERRIDVNLAVAALEPPLHLPVFAASPRDQASPTSAASACSATVSCVATSRGPRSAPQLAERSQRV